MIARGRMGVVLTVVLGASACGACEGRGAAPLDAAGPVHVASTASSASAEPGRAELKLHLEYGFGGDGLRAVMEQGVASISASGLELRFSTALLRCGAAAPDASQLPRGSEREDALDASAALSMRLVVPPGPRGDFFASRGVGVPIAFESSGAVHLEEVPAPAVRVVLEHVGDGRARGTLAFDEQWNVPQYGPYRGSHRYTAKGRFDVPICADDSPPSRVMPAFAADADAPFAGEIGGQRFVARSALVVVRVHRWTMFRYVAEVDLYAEEAIGCADRTAHAPAVRFEKIGAAGEVGFALTEAQPAHVRTSRGAGWGWLALDASPLYDRGRVRGVAGLNVSRASAPGAGDDRASGTFDAAVCVLAAWDAGD